MRSDVTCPRKREQCEYTYTWHGEVGQSEFRRLKRNLKSGYCWKSEKWSRPYKNTSPWVGGANKKSQRAYDKRQTMRMLADAVREI